MQVHPYVNYNGNCREAFSLYERVLGGEIQQMITHEDMPMEGMPDDWEGMILHASLKLGEFNLTGSDTPPDWYSPPSNMHVLLQVDTPDEAERIFATLSEGGSVQMPIGEQPWAHRFAMFSDRFGTPWIINCDKAA